MSNVGKPRKIIEPETGREWRSVAALCRETGWSFQTVVRHISAGDPLGSRIFVFADDAAPSKTPKLDEIVKKLRDENHRLRTQLAKLRSAK